MSIETECCRSTLQSKIKLRDGSREPHVNLTPEVGTMAGRFHKWIYRRILGVVPRRRFLVP